MEKRTKYKLHIAKECKSHALSAYDMEKLKKFFSGSGGRVIGFTSIDGGRVPRFLAALGFNVCFDGDMWHSDTPLFLD